MSKTLRFELQPQKETKEHIEKSGILLEDEERAQDYKTVKRLMDEFHKAFISDVLGKYHSDLLEKYQSFYVIQNKSEQEKREMQKIEASLRKEISHVFKNDERYKRMFGSKIVTEDLAKIAKTPEEKKAVDNFKAFTTYFQGFFENRKNMYSEEEKSTAIAYRIVNQNLPKYLDNIKTFQILINTGLREKIEELQTKLKDELQGHRIEDYFQRDFYWQVLTNEAITLYNTIIGGVVPSNENDTKVRGINEYVTLYNQQNAKTQGATKLPKLKMLYKQILSDRQTFSFVDDRFENDQEILDEIKCLASDLKETVLDDTAINSLRVLMENIASYDLSRIYIKNGSAITRLSNHVLGDWAAIKIGLEKQYDQKNEGKKKSESYYDKRDKYIKSRDSYSFLELNQAAELYSGHTYRLEEYYASLGEKDGKDILTLFESSWQQAQELLHADYSGRHDLMREKENVTKIKDLMDLLKGIESFVRPLLGKGNEADKDEEFYGEFDLICTKLKCITPLYNKVRNYLTRKPYSTEKIKLNFQNQTLLDGWDLNKERANHAVILRKDGLYYLGIMQKKYNTVFLKDVPEGGTGECYEKMEYKQIPNVHSQLPRILLKAQCNREVFSPSEEIIKNYDRGSHIKGETFNITECRALIDYFKASIAKQEDWKRFDFHFTDTKDYDDISQFYHEVEKQGYSLRFKKIPADYIDSLVKDGKLYLFKIYNKDFSEHTKGRPNLHTIYWKMLFDERNLQNVVYKLNGKAEIFFRKASIKEKLVVHHANEAISRRTAKADEKKETSKFPYDIIKDRRYTVDKYQFHVPITMNFCAEGNSQLNMQVMDAIRNTENIHVIGIDRGERNLLYATVVNSEGKIVYQDSLNKIKNGKGYKQDYRSLLEDRERKRDEARQNWMEIESIKELKEGYLSQAIHEITRLMLKYNAIVVLEDLNFGFKNGRKKVERQVYQKFEQMLIDKLNYFVDKERDPEEPGGALNAYQLTSKFESFAKLGQQSGFLFYVPAWNTSKIDPTTGFVNLLYPKYTNQEEARKFIRQFDRIRLNKEAGYFEFDLDYSKFTDRATGSRTKWTLCSRGERIVNFRNPKKNNKWDTRIVPLTEEIKDLLVQYQISLEAEDLRETICETEGKDFYERFIYYIRLIVQLRNSDTEEDIDYILSPVKNEKGEFFDSRDELKDWPKNADANGAYNIARKGLWVVEQIRKQSGYRIKLAMSNKEWLDYAQTHVTL